MFKVVAILEEFAIPLPGFAGLFYFLILPIVSPWYRKYLGICSVESKHKVTHSNGEFLSLCLMYTMHHVAHSQVWRHGR